MVNGNQEVKYAEGVLISKPGDDKLILTYTCTICFLFRSFLMNKSSKYHRGYYYYYHYYYYCYCCCLIAQTKRELVHARPAKLFLKFGDLLSSEHVFEKNKHTQHLGQIIHAIIAYFINVFTFFIIFKS